MLHKIYILQQTHGQSNLSTVASERQTYKKLIEATTLEEFEV